MMKKKLLPLLIAALCSGTALADERESLEGLKQTTLNLIDALVETGVLTREKADQLVAEAQARAARTVARAKKDGTVRVQYVPESVKNEIREQLKQEVLAQARTEGWAAPNAIPEWTERLKFEGDIRVRYQNDRFADGNTSANALAGSAVLNPGATNDDYPLATRFPGGVSLDQFGLPNGNVSDDVNRLRVRARLGLLAKITDGVSAGLRMVTGNTTDRVSTNQTLGSNFNKYSFLVDRAYLKLDPADWLSVSAGRIPNPWFATDMVWDEDLNFDGVAATVRRATPGARLQPFATAGWFPLRAENPPGDDKQWLAGAQLGTDFDLNSRTRMRFGLAKYKYGRVEGRVDPHYDTVLSEPLRGYGRYAYASNFRQKGNTLVQTNHPLDSTEDPIYGLAARFEPWVATFSADLAHFDPVHVLFSAEWVKNTGFDRNEILRRTGLRMTDGRDNAYHFKVQVGMPAVRASEDWQVFASYRYIGSDALIDGFVDSDFGLGGTNLKGFVLGGAYGLYRDTALGLRWYSARSIDSLTYDPTLIAGQRYEVDTVMMDLSVRF